MTYEGLLAEVLVNGEERTDRTGTGTLSIFSPAPLVYDLRQMHMPLITSKTVPWKMALREFMWMLSGSTDTRDLRGLSPAMANIWDKWADEDHNVGPTYGAQYRDAGGTLLESAFSGDVNGLYPDHRSAGVDQLAEVIRRLANTPDTRRAVISLWSVPELEFMTLEPCMVLFQFSLRGPKLDQLELHVYQRSADLMLGVPFDLFQAGVLAHLIAREVGIMNGRHVSATKLTWTAGDAHIYNDQVTAVQQVLYQSHDMPRMRAKIELPNTSHKLRLLDGSLTAGHINVVDYVAAPAVSAPIAV